MKLLKERFRRDGLLYTLLKRNDLVGLCSVGGTYTDKPTHFEVFKIYLRKDKYVLRESLPTNEVFGRDRSKSFIDYELALKYFDELTDYYLGEQRVVSEVRAAA